MQNEVENIGIFVVSFLSLVFSQSNKNKRGKKMEEKQIKVWPLVGMLMAVVLTAISVFLPIATSGSRTYESLIVDSGGETGRTVLIGAIIIGILPIAALITKKTLLSKLAGILGILGGLGLAGIQAVLYYGLVHFSISPAAGMYLGSVGAVLGFVMGIASLRSKKS
ncbi:hypothetical protein [Enterococcus sp. BWR-S5]|uniref:hypothetical protein n=1 Tax=Enterococcus sp. BWR-S5 TaxID=2787714 RepID=UPI0019242D0B|nr:hypothetical protein [Enterococcus sp. BWR-S5]MBL1225584.1 hypothetical protein [Enterococcus sp. BWR-S5]